MDSLTIAALAATAAPALVRLFSQWVKARRLDSDRPVRLTIDGKVVELSALPDEDVETLLTALDQSSETPHEPTDRG